MLVLFGLGLAGLSHASFMRVEQVVVRGAKTIASEKIEALVREELVGSYAYLFARSNVFMYPRKAIIKKVLSSSPVIKHVEVVAEDLHTLTVVVLERSPKALWCSGVCYFMDEDGVVYEQAPEFSAPVYIAYEGKGQLGELPRQYLSIEEFRALSALVDALAQTQPDTPIRRVEVDEHDDVFVHFEGDFVLIFSLGDKGGDIFERFGLARSAEPVRNKKLSDLEYLDLRFGDKLYYKFK